MLTAKEGLKKTEVNYLMVCHLTNRDEDKAQTFNDFLASVFKANDGLWDPWKPGLEDCDLGDRYAPN